MEEMAELGTEQVTAAQTLALIATTRSVFLPQVSQIPSFSLPTPSMWYTCTEKKDQLLIAVNANHLAKKAIYEITVLS